MANRRNFQLVLAGVTLAAGLGLALYLSAGDKGLRPKDGPVRVAFAAPAADGGQPTPAHYQAQVNDVMGEVVETVSPLEFTTASGPVDSHVVWLILGDQRRYLVRVRGVSAAGAVGVWSEWSDLYTNIVSPSSSGLPPAPPTD